MFGSIASDHAQRFGDRSAGNRCGDRQRQGRQSRRHQVDEIVEPRRCPAKRPVAFGTMPDHGVGGVDGLVGHQSGQPQQRQPEHRRHHPIGKILGAGFDCGPAHAGFIELLGIAPDDHGHRSSGAGQTAFGECRAHFGDVLIEASLCDEDGSDQCEHDVPQGGLRHGHLNQKADQSGYSDDHGCACDSSRFALSLRPVLAIERAIKMTDQGSDPCYRMTQSPPEPIGIAD